MMGPPSPNSDHSKFNASTGLTPRMCKALFDSINSEISKTEKFSYRVEMSYYEIYNEKVYCLLDPTTNDSLRPREDPKAGPYVENLSAIEVSHYVQVAELMKLGNKTRHTSRTKMNDRSSRSHAVFCLTITKSEFDKTTGDSTEWISRVNLVDLAGSERTNKAGTEGDTLKEGININKSLTSLGMVIKRLADINDPSVQTDGNYVPYRDSTLTWLLKDNLGGNSRTVMLATLSPCVVNYEETLTTLRYAERVKLIKNVPSVNKRASNRKIIRDLRSQIRELNKQLQHSAAFGSVISVSGGAGEGAAICHRGTPSALWASAPFLQTDAAYNQPFIWFLREGFTFVTAITSYAALAAEDDNYTPPKSPSNSTSGKPRKRSATHDHPLERRASGFGVKRTPSFMQPTLASGFKDVEVSEHLKGSKPNEWGRDLAHTLLKEEEHEKEKESKRVQRVRSADLGSGKKMTRRRSTSTGLGGRKDSARHKTPRKSIDSVSRALDMANAKITNNDWSCDEDIMNIKEGGFIQIDHEQSEGEDEEEPAAASSSKLLSVQHPAKLRSSSVLGVSLSSFGKKASIDTGSNPPQSQTNTPRGFEYDHLRSCWEDASSGRTVAWPDPSTLPYETSSIHSIKLTGLPPQQEDNPQPYAVFQVIGDKISILPIGNIKLNGNPMNSSSGSVQLPSRCELQFGEHPPFMLNNPLTSSGRKLSVDVGEFSQFGVSDGKGNGFGGIGGVSGDSEESRAIQRRASELVEDAMHRTRDDIALKDASATSVLQQQQQTIQLQREDTKRQDERIKLLEDELTRLRKKQCDAASKVESGKQLVFERQITGEWKMSADTKEALKGEYTLVKTSDAERLKRELLEERAEHEFTKRDLQNSAQQEREVTHRQLQQTQERLLVLQTTNATIRDQLSESTAKNEERIEMQRKLDEVTKSLAEGEAQRLELTRQLRKMDALLEQERKEMLEKLNSEEVQQQHRVIQSEVNDKYRQLDILRAQIGDKKQAAKQLQDSYNERLTDLEREAWDKHRAIKELQSEENEATTRVQQLKQEESRLSEKLNRIKKAKEDMLDSKELNSIDGYEFSGGLRLDDVMFRNKGIQLSRQSRTPICLRFTSTSLLVFNSDAVKQQSIGASIHHHALHASTHRRAPSPAGHRSANVAAQSTSLSPAPVEPIKEIVYEKIQKIRQIDGCVLQIASQGYTSDLSILCDNRLKRNSIHKLLMLKTKGVILPIHHNEVSDVSHDDASPVGSPGMLHSSPPMMRTDSAQGSTSRISKRM
eukprot:TRINITY_DN1211_c1_g1_i1.p1 TRINITY_DN1211_c1_g1~~TRINITY_DN1211_c1_g1_i1.p1  ORF type:complete len:1402 (+),score=293.33 TRINITY_DN1211_c1_g1_i1:396-4208(+)